jgi:hypothetical protein
MNDVIEWILTPFYLVFLMAGISLMMIVGILLVPYYIMFGVEL